jgi:hypothetical protein
VVVLMLVVVFYLGLRCCLVNGWDRGGGTSNRVHAQPKCGMVPNAERRAKCHFGKGRKISGGVQQCRKPWFWLCREQATLRVGEVDVYLM